PIEDSPQILFRLADVLGDHLAEVNSIEIELQVAGKHLGSHRFAGSACAGEQCVDAQPPGAFRGETPFVVNARAVADLGGDVAQSLLLRCGRYQIAPSGDRFNSFRQVVQSRTRVRAAGVPELFRKL